MHLVIGANGFIGAHLCARMSNQGHELGLILGSGDRWRLDALAVHTPAVSLDEVVWSDVASVTLAAGFGSPVGFGSRAVTSLGRELAFHRSVLERVLEAEADPLVVFLGSRTQYGVAPSGAVIEEHRGRPTSAYSLEKQMIDDLYALAWEQAGVRSVRLRVTNPFGPLEWHEDRRHGLASIFLAQFLTSGAATIFGEGTDLRDYVWIGDLVELIEQVVVANPSGSVALNAGSGTGTPIRDLADAVRRSLAATGLSGLDIQHVEAPAAAQAVETGDFVASIAHATAHFGWLPHTDLATGVQELVRTDLDRIRRAVAG